MSNRFKVGDKVMLKYSKGFPFGNDKEVLEIVHVRCNDPITCEYECHNEFFHIVSTYVLLRPSKLNDTVVWPRFKYAYADEWELIPLTDLAKSIYSSS